MDRNIILLLFFFSFVSTAAVSVNAQSSIDSLRALLQTTSDEEIGGLQLYMQLQEAFVEVNPDSSILYGKLALKHMLPEYKTSLSIRIKSKLSAAYLQQERNTLAKEALDEALEVVSEEDTASLTDLLYQYGQVQYNLGDYNQSENLFDSVIQYVGTSDELFLSKLYLAKSNLYGKKRNYAEAILFGERGLSIAQRLNAVGVQHTAYMNIGTVYLSKRDYARAQEYFLKALTYFEAEADLSSLNNLYNNLGLTSYLKGEYDRALHYFDSCISISRQLKLADVAFVPLFINKANIYRDQQNTSLALAELEKTHGVYPDDSKHHYKGVIPFMEGLLLSESGKRKAGFNKLNEALLFSRKIDHKGLEKNILKRLTQVYERYGAFEKALGSYKEYIAVRDTLVNVHEVEKITSTRLKFEHERQQYADSIEYANQLFERESRLKAARKSRWLFTVISVLLLSLAIALYRAFRLSKTANMRIADEKAEADRQRARAERSEQYEEQFLANMSHDIRTPMNAISGMVKILRRNPHPDTQQPYLEAMDQSATNLLVLLNDILDLSKIQAGKLDVNQKAFQLRPLLNNIHQLFRAKAQEKSLDFNLNIEDKLPKVVISDPARINQVLVNLVGNAFKFTDEGSITLSVVSDSSALLFHVHDTGLGISKEDQVRIFESFEQSGDVKALKAGGTGLGLSISNQLAELMGGSLSLQSEKPSGSTFTLSIPLVVGHVEEVDIQTLNESEVKALGEQLTGISVLLVEDNRFNQMLATDDLAYCIPDIKLTIANNGEEAVNLISKNKYDIILMDVDMPVMNGYEATRTIRKIGKKDLPILAMTASLLEYEIQKCFDAGMDGYVPKPYQLGQLIGGMHAALNK